MMRCVAGALLLAIGSGLLVLMAGALAAPPAANGPASAQPAEAPQFVGSESCGGCHPQQAKLWRGSQHRHAMDHATEQTVRGDFNDATFDYAGTRSRFFRKDGQFWVETDGPDGQLGMFQIKYTFGVEPLQQYLIVFPDGRFQALSIAWDSRAKDQGNNGELLSAAINVARALGDRAAALRYAEQLARLAPDDARLADLIRELKR